MPKVMIICPETGAPVFTGVELPRKSKLIDQAAIAFRCSACGKQHGVSRPFFEDAEPTAFHKYWVALDRRPTIAAEIGVLINCAAMVEWYLPQLMIKLGIDQGDALVIAGHFQSFSARIDLLEGLARRRSPKNASRQAVESFIPRMRAGNTIRNKYAHAQYGLGPTEDSVVIYPFSGDARKTPKILTETIDSVVEDVNFFKCLCCDLSDYFTQSKTPMQ